MAKYKVSELEGVLLDAAVVLAEGGFSSRGESSSGYERSRDGIVKRALGDHGFYTEPFRPSISWVDAGPIIEQEGIGLALIGGPLGWWAHYGMGSTGDLDGGSYGPTPLIAAMRCFVASKFGEEIDL